MNIWTLIPLFALIQLFLQRRFLVLGPSFQPHISSSFIIPIQESLLEIYSSDECKLLEVWISLSHPTLSLFWFKTASSSKPPLVQTHIIPVMFSFQPPHSACSRPLSPKLIHLNLFSPLCFLLPVLSANTSTNRGLIINSSLL